MQAHQHGNQSLVEQVILGCSKAQSILEFYAGSGNFTLPLAQANSKRKLTCIEIDPKAVHSLQTLAQEHNLAINARLESASKIPKGRFDHVLIAPPRSGAKHLIKRLAMSRIPNLTYVSCHPATLIRDLQILADHNWILDDYQIFHLFPESGHAEVYVRLTRTSSSSR